MNFYSKKSTISLLCRSLKGFGSSKNIIEKFGVPSFFQMGFKNRQQKKISSKYNYMHLNNTKGNNYSFCTTGENK
jgi:hypothetical protein